MCAFRPQLATYSMATQNQMLALLFPSDASNLEGISCTIRSKECLTVVLGLLGCRRAPFVVVCLSLSADDLSGLKRHRGYLGAAKYKASNSIE